MPKCDEIEFEGVVIEAVKDRFKVLVKGHTDYIVMCTLAGKLRQNGIRVLQEDHVKIAVSPYDTTKGRIIYRSK